MSTPNAGGWFDDALDVWAVHGLPGAFGGVAMGVFDTARSCGVKGLWDGSPRLLPDKLIAIAANCDHAIAITFAILKAPDVVMASGRVR